MKSTYKVHLLLHHLRFQSNHNWLFFIFLGDFFRKFLIFFAIFELKDKTGIFLFFAPFPLVHLSSHSIVLQSQNLEGRQIFSRAFVWCVFCLDMICIRARGRLFVLDWTTVCLDLSSFGTKSFSLDPKYVFLFKILKFLRQIQAFQRWIAQEKVNLLELTHKKKRRRKNK